ncbi:ABC transporter ATP-binding protein [Aminobacter niigataensis]|uniref:ABC transporter ATP-binding protein n=1 Tax=Aminobacter niigataensis TaxID=83265 RepID=UPI0031B5C668
MSVHVSAGVTSKATLPVSNLQKNEALVTNASVPNSHESLTAQAISGDTMLVEKKSIMTISDLSVVFPAYGKAPNRVLKHISLDIPSGEILGLVGESGSGKTTLARAIMGMVPAPGIVESGRIILDELDLSTLDDKVLRAVRGKELSMMVPNPRSELSPLLTVGKQISNVAYQHLGLTRKEADAKALAMLKAVQIPDVERRFNAYPHELSGGMAQRVIIAIALMCSPRFIISDDATSGLDVTVQAQVLDLMNTLVRDRGASMLFVTRDIGVTAHFCNRLAVMYGGEIVEIADTNSFFARPAHPYSVMLLSAFSHNPTLRAKWTKNPEEVSAQVAVEGCPFRHRCVRAREKCEVEHPGLTKFRERHEVRCHYPVGGRA